MQRLFSGYRHNDGPQLDRKQIITSDEILELKEIPKSLMVLGAGAVGVEFASMFARFGTDVTILELLPLVGASSAWITSAEPSKR